MVYTLYQTLVKSDKSHLNNKIFFEFAKKRSFITKINKLKVLINFVEKVKSQYFYNNFHLSEILKFDLFILIWRLYGAFKVKN